MAGRRDFLRRCCEVDMLPADASGSIPLKEFNEKITLEKAF